MDKKSTFKAVTTIIMVLIALGQFLLDLTEDNNRNNSHYIERSIIGDNNTVNNTTINNFEYNNKMDIGERESDSENEDLHSIVSDLSNKKLYRSTLDKLVVEYGRDNAFDIAWYLRNYYYAQAGMYFEEESPLTEFFREYDWYTAYNFQSNKKEITSKLSEMQYENMELIYRWEHDNDSPHKVD